MSPSVFYHDPSTTSFIRDGVLGNTMCRFIVFAPIDHSLCTDGPTIRPPTNPMTIQPKGSMVYPPTVRHPAPTNVQNTMHIVNAKNISKTGLEASK